MRLRMAGLGPRVGTWDVVASSGLTLLAQAELAASFGWYPAAAVMSLVVTGALLVRRVAPLSVTTTIVVVFGLQGLVLDPAPQLLGNGLAMLVAVYTSSAERGPWRGLPVLLLSFVASVVFERSLGDVRPAGGDALLASVVWAIGVLVHRRGLLTARRLATADEEVRSVEEKAEASLVAERRRIARELHDVVSHAVTVVVLQARGARSVLDHDPQQARDALDAIEMAGQEALDEMRRLVSFLREPTTSTTPQPGLDDVPALVESARRKSPVTFEVTGAPVPLGVGPGLTAYRVVQEGLTNALRHAPGAPVDVRLHYADSALTITVDNPRPAEAVAVEAGGFGLVGLRERVELYGGSLTCGSAGSGWRVVGVLPVVDTSARLPSPEWS